MEDAKAGIVAALPESDDPGIPRKDQKTETFSFASVVLSTARALSLAGSGFLLQKTPVHSLRCLSLKRYSVLLPPLLSCPLLKNPLFSIQNPS